jgi:hypothetical protein
MAEKAKPYDAEGSNVEKEADEKKRGGRVKRKHGGAVKDDARVSGKLAKMRLDRPARKDGGRVGADKSPLSSAANSISHPSGHSTDD